jgi:hypothetical protein
MDSIGVLRSDLAAELREPGTKGGDEDPAERDRSIQEKRT